MISEKEFSYAQRKLVDSVAVNYFTIESTRDWFEKSAFSRLDGPTCANRVHFHHFFGGNHSISRQYWINTFYLFFAWITDVDWFPKHGWKSISCDLKEVWKSWCWVSFLEEQKWRWIYWTSSWGYYSKYSRINIYD